MRTAAPGLFSAGALMSAFPYGEHSDGVVKLNGIDGVG